jgi:type VI protein secretion system component Hcp
MKNKLKLLLILSLIGLQIQAQSSIVMFMDVAGIAGENVTNNARASVFTPTPSAATIAVLSYAFNESSGLNIGTNPTRPPVEVDSTNNIREMTISFRMDKATPFLMEKMWQRQLIATINIYSDRLYNNGVNQDEFIRTKLTNAFIKSITFQSSNENAPVLNMTVTFEQIERGFAQRNPSNVLVSIGSIGYNYLIAKKI